MATVLPIIREQVQAALRYLSSQCDGAQEQDGHGFNRMDSQFGKSLASQNYLTEKQVAAAIRMLKKYHGQLESAGLQIPMVDNNVEQVVAEKKENGPVEIKPVVVEAKAEEPVIPTNQKQSQAVEDLRNGGTLSRSLPGYQERGPQIEMATLVEQAIAEEKHAILEAKTGSGKSMAYLIPIVRSGKKAIVSTANKALQEQLFNKDVPFLQKHLQHFDAALVKGMGNYVCLDRLEKEQNEGLSFYAQDQTLPKVVDATRKPQFNGDFESLPFQISSELRGKINGNPDECARRKCPLFGQCYYYKMRAGADHAQVIVTNHSMLMLDTVSGGKLLPKRDVVVVDEAHMLEGVASDAFTVEIAPTRLYTLLALKKLREHTDEKLQKRATEQVDALWRILEMRFPEDHKINRLALLEAIQEGLTLSKTIGILASQLRERKPGTLTEKEEGLYNRLIERTQQIADDLQAVFALDNDEYVYYLERYQVKQLDQVKVAMVPLTVANLLRETLFTDNKAVCTSATLATPAKVGGQPSFDFYQQQVGLDDPETLTKILPTVFDYEHNALLYLPNDLPEPAFGNTKEAKTYEAAISAKMLALVEASQGRAFLLFSSRRMMNIALDQIRFKLERQGYNLFVQNDYPTTELVKRFKTTEKAVLFGLRTFWEGVDVSGEALSLVVIDKLPFIPTDDPVMSAKMKYIERTMRQHPFSAYSLPMVVLQLNQGVGRLIRSDTDTGVMAILDSRMTTATYGKKILTCLPPAKQVNSIQDVEQFFATPRVVVEEVPQLEQLTLEMVAPTQVQERQPEIIAETAKPEPTEIKYPTKDERPTGMAAKKAIEAGEYQATVSVAYRFEQGTKTFLDDLTAELAGQGIKLNKSKFLEDLLKQTPEYQKWLKSKQ